MDGSLFPAHIIIYITVLGYCFSLCAHLVFNYKAIDLSYYVHPCFSPNRGVTVYSLRSPQRVIEITSFAVSSDGGVYALIWKTKNEVCLGLSIL